jgi:hypothetical protein
MWLSFRLFQQAPPFSASDLVPSLNGLAERFLDTAAVLKSGATAPGAFDYRVSTNSIALQSTLWQSARVALRCSCDVVRRHSIFSCVRLSRSVGLPEVPNVGNDMAESKPLP